MEVKKLNIKLCDINDLSDLFSDTILNLMKREMTGHITFHMVDGVIKGYEFTFFGRTLQKIKTFF